jgi:hypothetical protein
MRPCIACGGRGCGACGSGGQGSAGAVGAGRGSDLGSAGSVAGPTRGGSPAQQRVVEARKAVGALRLGVDPLPRAALQGRVLSKWLPLPLPNLCTKWNGGLATAAPAAPVPLLAAPQCGPQGSDPIAGACWPARASHDPRTLARQKSACARWTSGRSISDSGGDPRKYAAGRRRAQCGGGARGNGLPRRQQLRDCSTLMAELRALRRR